MAGITHEIDDKNIVMAIKSDAVAATKELVEAAVLKRVRYWLLVAVPVRLWGNRSEAGRFLRWDRPSTMVSTVSLSLSAYTLQPSAVNI